MTEYGVESAEPVDQNTISAFAALLSATNVVERRKPLRGSCSRQSEWKS